MRILSPGNRPSAKKIPPLLSPGRIIHRFIILMIFGCSLLIADDVSSQTVPANLTITFNGKRVSLKQALSEIRKQTKYDVLYNPEQIDSSAIVSVNAKNLPLEEYLKTILAKQSLSYSFINTTIVVFRKDGETNLTAKAEKELQIDGAVFDEKSTTPLAGVSVMLVRAGKGTQTNSKGQFTLKSLDDNDSLQFTIIGYEPVTLLVKHVINSPLVSMKISTSELDVAVVKAFGITSNRLATGSITRISGDEIRRQPVMNPLLALQGRVPGMVITPTTGYANSPVKVEIRGRSTLNENFSGEPLYVIDGVPRVVLDVSNWIQNKSSPSPGPVQGSLSYTRGQSILYGINPNDIESIEVLRDGDATAMYGTRAANGVVLITTKKARSGKTQFGININQGVSVISRNAKMLNTQQYLQMRREAFKNDGITPTIENAPDLMLWDTTRYTNWQKALLGTGRNTDVGMDLSGGDVRTSIRLSAMYSRRTGVTQRSGKNEVIAVNTSITHRSLNQKLTVMLSANFNSSYVDAIDNGGDFTMPPNAPSIFNNKGELNFEEWNAGNLNNDIFPLAKILKPNISKTNSLQGTLNIGYEIMKGLTLNTQLSYFNSQNSNDVFNPIASLNPVLKSFGNAFFSTTKAGNYSLKSTLDYSRWIGRGRLGVTAGASYESQSTRAVTTSAVGFQNDDLITSITNALYSQTTDKEGLYRIASAFATINYNWENKYIINLNGRRDGSSRFAPDRQFGNFGSIGASWILSEEKWMKKFMPSWLSFVKLRTSHALTGSDAIGDYQFLSLWSGLDGFNSSARYEYNGVRSFVPNNPVNQQYHWESKKSWDGAIRLGFLDNKFSMELVAYRNISDNALVSDFLTPVYTGFPTVVTNSNAKVLNKGLELTLSGTLVQQKNFTWNVSLNVSANRNKLLAYPGLETSPNAKTYRIGYPITSQFLLHYIGVDPLTGYNSFVDYNKDGTITADPGKTGGKDGDDRYVVLDISPKFDGGLSSDFTLFKSFSVNMQFTFRKGLVQDLFASTRIGTMKNMYLPEEVMNNHWRKPGDHAKYPLFSTMASNSLNYSDGQFTDGSFVQLYNLQLSYQLPEKLIGKAGMKNCIFSMSVNNVFTISKYKGSDPNIGVLDTPPTPRIINARLSFMF